jgi:hypothetical protein
MRLIKKGGRVMSTEDRYSVAEFARRYKVSEKELPAFCELFGVSQDTVLTREEFKGMFARFESSGGVEEPPQPTQEPQREAKEEFATPWAGTSGQRSPRLNFRPQSINISLTRSNRCL